VRLLESDGLHFSKFTVLGCLPSTADAPVVPHHGGYYSYSSYYHRYHHHHHHHHPHYLLHSTLLLLLLLVVVVVVVVVVLLGLVRYLHTGRWNRVTASMRKFALYKRRSPVHQSRYSYFALTKNAQYKN
jgi:hypothetical protein